MTEAKSGPGAVAEQESLPMAVPRAPEGIGPEWVCTNCGTPGAERLEGHPSFDPRYGIGYCDTCSKPNPDRKTPRPFSHLIRVERFDRDKWRQEKEKRELQALIREFAAGKDKVRLKGPQAVRLLELWDKYHTPGWAPTQDLRLDVADYLHKEQTRKSVQKASKHVRDRSGA